MGKKKTLKELTIKDNFMFGAVMAEEENCRGFLELALGIPIREVAVSKEKSIVYRPEYRGIRLDVYAKDEENTRYNIEMQALTHPALGKRVRYYQSEMDMDLLESGQEYARLPDTIVIFVCDFDPFGEKKYRYTFQNICEESEHTRLNDGRRVLFLSTCGENASEVPEELVKFLAFVKAGLEESEQDFGDPYIRRLQRFIARIKESREMEGKFMVLEEMLKEERNEGIKEGRNEGRKEGIKEGQAEAFGMSILAVLNQFGEVPDSLRETIEQESSPEVLKEWLAMALGSSSVEEFQQKI